MWSRILRRAALLIVAGSALQLSDRSVNAERGAVRIGQSDAHRLASPPSAKRCRSNCRAAIPRDDVLRHAGGTYIEDAISSGDSLLSRWSHRINNPVRVAIATGDSVPGWQPSFVALARRAFEEWTQADVPVRFLFVDDTLAAEVRVRWVETLPEQRAGFIRWTSDRRGWLREADITLATVGSDGRPIGEDGIRAIALHEVGHLLGLGHSFDAADVMSAWVSARELSDRDRATVRLLYALPAGRVD